MIDFTKPLRVKGCSALGVRVVDSAFVARQEFVPLALVVITERDGVDRVAVFGADGIECDLTGMIAKEPVTLENVPEKHVRYSNAYKTPDGEISWLKESWLKESRARADAVAGNGRIACVRVEFEEGQYDD